MTEILIKRLSDKVLLPKYETEGSSGLDLAAHIDESIEIKPGSTAIIPTGIAVSIPKNFEIQIRPRSGLAAKNQISVLNTPGTIDADYRGELKVILINLGAKSFLVENERSKSSYRKVPISDFQSQFSMSKIIRISPIFFHRRISI